MITPFPGRMLMRPAFSPGTQDQCLRILVIEQDPWLSSLVVQKSPYWEQHIVDTIREHTAARALVLGERYDAIVLAQAERAELDLCRHLRTDGSTTPIVILNAHATVEDVVNGLDAGADDYLTGYLDLDELLARLRALVRRHRSNRNVPVRGYHPLALRK